MQKVVAKVGLTRHVVAEFEKEVNELLEQGFHLDLFEVEHGFLRIFCTAILCDEDHDEEESSYYDESSAEGSADADEGEDENFAKKK